MLVILTAPIWQPRFGSWWRRPRKLIDDIMLASGHLKYGAGGHLTHNAAGHLVYCTDGAYIQAKKCSDNTDADLWFLVTGSGTIDTIDGSTTATPYYFTKAGVTYFVQSGNNTSVTPGTMAASYTTATACPSIACAQCAGGTLPRWFDVTFASQLNTGSCCGTIVGANIIAHRFQSSSVSVSVRCHPVATCDYRAQIDSQHLSLANIWTEASPGSGTTCDTGTPRTVTFSRINVRVVYFSFPAGWYLISDFQPTCSLGGSFVDTLVNSGAQTFAGNDCRISKSGTYGGDGQCTTSGTTWAFAGTA